MSATWTCPQCNRDVLGSICYCMASEEAKLHGRIAELEQRLADREAQLSAALDHILDLRAAMARWGATLGGGEAQ